MNENVPFQLTSDLFEYIRALLLSDHAFSVQRAFISGGYLITVSVEAAPATAYHGIDTD